MTDERAARRRLWRADLGALLHHRRQALAILGATTVVGLTTTLGVVFAGAAGHAVVDAELAGRSASGLGVRATTGLPEGTDPTALTTGIDDLRAGVGLHEALGRPMATLRTQPLDLVTTTGQRTRTIVVARDDFARHVDVVHEAEGRPDGVWVPDALADELGLTVGDEVVIGAERFLPSDQPDPTTVAVIYRDLRTTDRAALDPHWHPLSYWFVLPPPGEVPLGYQAPEPVLLADVGTAARTYQGGVDARGTWQPDTTGFLLQLDVPLHQPGNLDPEGLDAAVAAVGELRSDLVSTDGRLGSVLAALGGSAPQVTSGAPGVADRVAAARAAVGAPLWVITLLGATVGLTTVGVVAAAGAATRRDERRLRLAQGLGPADQARSAAREAAPWALAGTIIGLGTAMAGVALLGPAGGAAGVQPSLLVGAMAGVAVTTSIATIAGVTAGLVRRDLAPRHSRLAPVGRVPWELGVGGLAMASGYVVVVRGETIRLDGDGMMQIDALGIAFPVLLIATVVLIAVRLLRPGLGMARAVPAGGRPVVLLVSRRLAHAPAAALALVSAGAITAGLVVYSATTIASTELTVAAKRSVAAGAEAVGVAASGTAPRSAVLGAPSTVVEHLELTRPNGAAIEVVGIDPTSFLEVAHMDARWLGADPQAVIDALATAPDGHIAAVAIGGADGGRLQVDARTEVLIHTVARLPAFPGSAGGSQLVVDAEALRGAAADGQTIGLRSRTQIWVASADDAVMEALGALTVAPPRRADDVATQVGLRAYTWSLNLLGVIAVCGALLAAIGVLTVARSRHHERAAAYALAARMGLPASAQRLVAATETVALLGVAALIGTAAALGAAALTVSAADPLPSLRPPALIDVPAGVIAVLPLWVVATAAWAGWQAHRSTAADGSGHRPTTADVLRLAR